MKSSLNVKKIMDEIRSDLKNNESQTLTLDNLVSSATQLVTKKFNNIMEENSARSKYLKYLQSLNLETRAIEEIESQLSKELRQANESVDIQTFQKIETSKKSLLRPIFLKIRRMLQEEVKFALNPIVSNQTKFNVHVVRTLNEIYTQLIVLEICNLYHELFLREPTDKEIQIWVDALQVKNFDIKYLRKKFKFSEEYQKLTKSLNYKDLISINRQLEKTNSVLTRSEIVHSYYELLDREPTIDEIETLYMGINKGKLSIDEIREKIRGSKEFKDIQSSLNTIDPRTLVNVINSLDERITRFEIISMYSKLLKREPTDEEIKYWHVQVVEEKMSITELENKIKNSEEYKNIQKNNN